jgi:hypothetical protein
MKTDIIKQEILLMINTFSQRELCEKNGSQNFYHQSYAEQLEKACWNGLLDELLIGIVERSASGKRLCLWHTEQGKCFLQIDLCNCPQRLEKHLSIDPYIFLPIVLQN